MGGRLRASPRSGANRSIVRIFDTLAKILRSQAPSSMTNTGATLFFHPSSLLFTLVDKSEFEVKRVPQRRFFMILQNIFSSCPVLLHETGQFLRVPHYG